VGLFWLCAWLLGFPSAQRDDGFFLGAGLHLARTGELANPWITGWRGYLGELPTQSFFFQPPLQAWCLAAWVKLWGVSVHSITGFAVVCGVSSAWVLASLILRAGGTALAAGIGALAVSAWLLQRGLRPESLGLFGVLLGARLMLSSITPRWAIGGFIGSLGVLAHAFTLTIIAPLTALIWLKHSYRLSSLVGVAAGLGAAALLFLFLIGGQIADFYTVFTRHAAFVNSTGESRWWHFGNSVFLGWEVYPYFAVLLSVLVSGVWIATKAQAARPALLRTGALLFVHAGLGFLIYPQYSVIFIVHAIALAPVFWNVHRPPNVPHWLLVVPSGVLLSWAALQIGLQSLAELRASTSPTAAVRAWLQSTRPEIVTFDVTSLRSVFAYTPPPGSLDVSWSWSPRTGSWPVKIGPRDVAVISQSSYASSYGGQQLAPNLIIAGRTFHSIRATKPLILVLGKDLPPPEAAPGLLWTYGP